MEGNKNKKNQYSTFNEERDVLFSEIQPKWIILSKNLTIGFVDHLLFGFTFNEDVALTALGISSEHTL